MRKLPAVLGCLIAALWLRSAIAQEIEPRVAVAAIYSDNPNHSSTGTAEGVLNGLVGVHIAHDGTVLYVDADASELHRQFLKGDYSSEDLPDVRAEVVASFVPDRFSWSFNDNLGQIAGVPFDTLALVDRRNLNVFQTGPQLFLPIAARDRIELSATYRSLNLSQSDIDNNLYEGHAAYIHLLGSQASVSLQYSYQDIQYRENPLYPESRVDSGYVSYSLETARTFFSTELGVETLRVSGSPSKSTPHAMLVFQRRISPLVTLNVEYQHGYSDAGQAFQSSSKNPFTTGSDQVIQALAASFKSDEAYAVLVRSGGRLLLALDISAGREQYDTVDTFDRRTYGADLAADYRLSSVLTVALRSGWFREVFPVTHQEDSWWQASVGLNRQLNRSLQLAFTLMRAQGAGENLTNHFVENRAVLALSYQPDAAKTQRIYDPAAQFRLYQRPVRGTGPAAPASAP